MTLERYRSLVPDWPRFSAALARPEPTTIRVRTGRLGTSELLARLETEGFGLEAVPGLPDVFHVRREPRPVSGTLDHWMGHFYIQQASTAVAAPALSPRPGEHVLDLCAAPGGKTTHVSDLLEERGCLVASDRSEKRIRGLLGNVYRLGHAGVLVVAADGREFPGGATFDRVLVDAPCSAEGNARRRGGREESRSDSFREYVTSLQEALLRRAIDLTRPGGVVLYATCTFAPEENEAVVDRVLADRPVALEPIELDVPHAPGLTRHGTRRFRSDLELAWRIYPHHLDSGGLFLARLRKTEGEGGATGEGWCPVPAAFPGEGLTVEAAGTRIEDGMTRLERSFGATPERLAREGWMARGDSVWGHRLDAWPLQAWQPSGAWRFVSLGVRVLREDRRYGLRPTNEGLRWLGDALARRRIALDHRACLRLLEGGRVRGEAEVGNGNVALELDGSVIGRGVLRDGLVRHEIPRARARSLREILSQEVTREARAGSEADTGRTDRGQEA